MTTLPQPRTTSSSNIPAMTAEASQKGGATMREQSMARTFDTLIESNLLLTKSVRELVKVTYVTLAILVVQGGGVLYAVLRR